jgi:hypothetical protein
VLYAGLTGLVLRVTAPSQCLVETMDGRIVRALTIIPYRAE